MVYQAKELSGSVLPREPTWKMRRQQRGEMRRPYPLYIGSGLTESTGVVQLENTRQIHESPGIKDEEVSHGNLCPGQDATIKGWQQLVFIFLRRDMPNSSPPSSLPYRFLP